MKEEIAWDQYFRECGTRRPPNPEQSEVLGDVVVLRDWLGVVATYKVSGDIAVECDPDTVPLDKEFKQSIRSMLLNWVFDYETHETVGTFGSVLDAIHRKHSMWRLIAEVAVEEMSDTLSEANDRDVNLEFLDHVA